MSQALATLVRNPATHRCIFNNAFSSRYHLERPAGCVQVPAVVGYVYMELQRRGYNAETWWRCYYQRFVQQNLPPPSAHITEGENTTTVTTEAGLAPSNDEGLCCTDGEARSTVFRAGAAVDADAVPSLCWERQRRRDTLGSHAKKTQTYGTPESLCTDTGRPTSPGAILPSGMTTPQWSTWIPLSLLFHLPFFPVPYPRSKEHNMWRDTGVMDEAEDELDDGAGGQGKIKKFGTTTVDGGQNTFTYVEAEQKREEALMSRFDGILQQGWTSSPSTTPVPAAALATADTRKGDTAATSLPQRRSWQHPFYDELFVVRKPLLQRSSFEDVNSREGRTSINEHATAALDWAPQLRALCPLEAPWHIVPLLSTVAGPNTSHTVSPHQSSTVAAKGSDRCMPSATSPTAATSTSSSSVSLSWPNPQAELQLASSYLPFLSGFWARKSRLLQNLPEASFFPFSVYPLFASQNNSTGKTVRRSKFGPLSTKWAAHMSPFAIRGSRDSKTRSGNVAPQLEASAFSNPPPFAHDGAFRTPQRTDSLSSPFSVLQPNWKAHAVLYFGRQYIPVACTTLACLFDSAVCAQHAIPLNVFGSPFTFLFNITRHRQQRHAPPCMANEQMRSRRDNVTKGVAGAAADSNVAPHTRDNAKKAAAITRELSLAQDATRPPQPSRSPWLERLQRIQLDQQRTSHAVSTSFNERVVEMRSAQHHNYFLFRSPYWLEVETLYERWGVHMVPGELPLRAGSDLYVNAEQTTDASRFTPATCVPHLQQEILFCDCLARCLWEVSQQLLSVIAPEVRPRRRGSKAICAWTYQALKERAAAAQRVSNLWIADEVIKKMGWTLCPVALRTAATVGERLGGPQSQSATKTILHVELPLESLHQHGLRMRLEGAARPEASEERPVQPSVSPFGNTAPHLFAPPPAPAPVATQQHLSRLPQRRFVTVFHSSCVVEQEQISFVATHHPQVLLLRVPHVTAAELRGQQRSSVLAMKPWLLTHLQKAAESALKNSSANSEQSGWDTHSAATVTSASSDSTGFETGSRHLDEVSLSELSDDAEAQQYLVMAKAKLSRYAAPWRNTKLTFASRLDLARLALQKGYRPENAHRWVSLDFLRSERRVRPVQRPAQTPEAASSLLSPASPTPLEGASVSSVVDAHEGLTAIDVEVHTALQRDEYNAVADNRAVMPFVESEPGRCAKGSFFSRNFVTIKMTLVNREELEWSSEISPMDRFMWLFKSL
ncbi:hypothetical protein ABB37_02860 [Leptomonas pyrrhocoris]|uniref:Uncharacterized protein n=1 Tax=Leptomonas pyrrhocoris TaxID=157538 RepID=A0A0N0DXM8_LEPPY|nr:hypothetical protein ABB37_02860 [Leptomonas pyrrhocoris]KPA83165.1 hypothetical protein ABB37_02860 [Leptomonas pyrrhocoris]|eukprot:XP_015661604.1 hypothetical protein ABB37_02860 [Leptomonas pyrrhocoris]